MYVGFAVYFVTQVGNLAESNVYIEKKVKAAADVGIEAHHIKLSRDVSQTEVSSITVSCNTSQRPPFPVSVCSL